ncbi:hypothetical protein RN001_009320 [Aquatica leii]|uniref:Uncharacterized protein n=1 Tax=Aquatica leii TaxID=1421715 RepID=A0AAN7PTM8_9COLE|nr:hypothetical protein RN001_009320 [Aquatica leii]
MSVATASLDSQFSAFARYAEGSACSTDGERITLTNADIWLKQAKLLDGKLITLTDTGVCFYKMKKRTISYKEFLKFLEDLALTKKMDLSELKTKLCDCGLPGAEEKKPEKKKFGT